MTMSSLEEIAARAKVTKRTVLRRFGSKESLFLAANERIGREEMRRRNEAPIGDVAAGVSVVIDSYERFGANRLRVLAQEDRIPVVAHDVAIGRELHWSWVRRTFAPLIAPVTGAARKRRIAALVALTDVYMWKLLRRDLGLTACGHRARARRTHREAGRRALMTRFLAYTSPARGHLYPMVATLLELHHRGHDVHVRTLGSEVAVLRELGLSAEAIDSAIEHTPLDTWRATTPQEGLALALATFAGRAVHEVPDLQEALASVDPDVLLVDITTVGAAAVAEAEGVPWARSIPLFQHFSMGPDPAAEVTMVPFGIAPRASRCSTSLAADWACRRSRVRRTCGVPRSRSTTPLRPFEDVELAFPPSFRLVGPGLWEPQSEAAGWLDEIDRPMVLVSVSSEFQRDDALVQVALEAMRHEDLDVIVTTAAHESARFEAPPNARVTSWLSHGPLVQRAACVVCHGGMGITQKALAAGVPVCVVPFGRDQFEVAGRVVASGAGTAVFPDALDAATLRNAIHDAMKMRAGAERVAAGFARAGGSAAAADALEVLAGTPSRPNAVLTG